MTALFETDLVPPTGAGDVLGQLPQVVELDAWRAYMARLAQGQIRRAADEQRADHLPAPAGWSTLENVR